MANQNGIVEPCKNAVKKEYKSMTWRREKEKR